MLEPNLNILMIGPYPAQPGMVVGGTQAVITTLAPALAAHDQVVQVTVLCFQPGARRAWDQHINGKLVIRFVPGQRHLNVLTRSFRDVRRARELVDALRPTLVHAQGIGWQGDVATQLGLPTVVTVHGLLPVEMQPMEPPTLRTRARLYLLNQMVRRVLRRAQVVVSISRYDATALGGLIMGQHVHIPNPVAPEFFRAAPPVLPPPRLVFAGVLRRRKNVEGLLRAFAIARQTVRTARLTLIGPAPNPPYADTIRELISTLGLDGSVELIGHVSTDRLVHEIRTSRALVLFSYEETLPTIIAQALVIGTPVVASRVGGVAEMLEDGEHGYVVEPGNEAMLAERLITLLQSPAQAERMGHQARADARQRYDPAVIAQQTVHAYRMAVEQSTLPLAKQTPRGPTIAARSDTDDAPHDT